MVYKKTKRGDLVHAELSYKIVGILFDVYNDLGYGFQEKHYQRAVAKALKDNNLSYKQQVAVPLKYKEKNIGKYYLDFLVENKIVIELKKGDYYSRKNISQIYNYLVAADIKLGLLVNFTKSGIKFKRILNIK